jgi:hypothetical protein
MYMRYIRPVTDQEIEQGVAVGYRAKMGELSVVVAEHDMDDDVDYDVVKGLWWAEEYDCAQQD